MDNGYTNNETKRSLSIAWSDAQDDYVVISDTRFLYEKGIKGDDLNDPGIADLHTLREEFIEDDLEDQIQRMKDFNLYTCDLERALEDLQDAKRSYTPPRFG